MEQNDIAALQALFHTAFASLSESVIIYDIEGNIVQMNVTAQRLFEVQQETFIGISCRQFLDYLRPHAPRCESDISSSKEEIWPPILQNEFSLCTPSGHKLQVQLTNAPVYNQQGQLIGGYMLFHDISAQHQQECRTLQAFTSLLTLVEKLVAIAEQEDATTSNEEIRTLSPILVAGKSLADIVAQVLNCRYVDVFALEPPDDRQHLLGASNLTPEQEQRLREETEQAPLSDYISEEAIARLHANQIVLLDLQQQPYVTPRSDFGARYRLLAPMVLQGQLIGLFITAKQEGECTDVHCAYSQEEIALAQGTARLTALVIAQVRLLEAWAKARATEQALQEINCRYDAFISIASHELKTPLTTIKGNVELALKRLKKLAPHLADTQRQQLQKPLETALQRTHVQARMIGELLDASRIQANKLTLLMLPCDLIEIVQGAINDMREAVKDRVILSSLPEPPIKVQADADRIGQVIMNYLANALKYSDPETPVYVDLTREDKLARVSVRDQGPGIPLEAQQRLWDRFYRVPGIEVRHGSGGGLGLGLHICKEIIELHNGQVGIQSTLGQGSTFWFTLPVER